MNNTERIVTPHRWEPGRIGTLTVAAVLMITVLYCRIRLLDIPLERDEGGFAYMAVQMLRGIPLYESGYCIKFPGIHVTYAFFISCFGNHVSSIHLGLLITNLGTVIMLYLSGRRLMAPEGAIISAGVYALFSVTLDVLGVSAHATHFVTFWAMAGIYLLLVWRESQRWPYLLVSGICLGISITMKQNGIFFTIPSLFLLSREVYHRQATIREAFIQFCCWGCGWAVPLGVMLLYVLYNGLFAPFWFWTIRYSLSYATESSFFNTLALKHELATVTQTTLPLWIVAGVGAIALFRKSNATDDRIFFVLFVIMSCLAVMPGGHYYPHYFILLLPALSYLIGVAYLTIQTIASSHTSSSRAHFLALACITAVCIIVVATNRSFLFVMGTQAVSKYAYARSPFAEQSQLIAHYITENTSPQDTVAVLGSEPQIYYYSDRNAATRHLFMYALAGNSSMAATLRKEMIEEVIANQPKVIILSLQKFSWGVEPQQIIESISEIEAYLANYYNLVGTMLINLDGTTRSLWGNAAYQASLVANPVYRPIYIYVRSN